MSNLYPLITTMFSFDSPVITFTLKDTDHSVCLDTILQCQINSKLVKVVRNDEEISLTETCGGKEESVSRDKSKHHRYVELPEEYEKFSYVFPFLFHFLETKHLVYPREKNIIQRFVEVLEYFDAFKEVQDILSAKHTRELSIKEVIKVLLEGSIKVEEQGEEMITDLDELNYIISKRMHRETMVVVTRIYEDGKRFIIFTIHGQHKTLKEMFPDKEVEEDDTYRNLSSVVRLGKELRNDKDFICELGSTLLYSIIGRLGFKLTCYSTFVQDEKDVYSGLWFFYRERQSGGRTRKSFGLTPRIMEPQKPKFSKCFAKK